jgi:hypothetical protein
MKPELHPETLGIYALSIIQYSENHKQNIRESRSVSLLRCGDGDTSTVWSLRKS